MKLKQLNNLALYLTKWLSLQALVFDQLKADVVRVPRTKPSDLGLHAFVLVALRLCRDVNLLRLLWLREL